MSIQSYIKPFRLRLLKFASNKKACYYQKICSDKHKLYQVRSSRPEVFCKKGVLRIDKIHRKTPAPESLF